MANIKNFMAMPGSQFNDHSTNTYQQEKTTETVTTSDYRLAPGMKGHMAKIIQSMFDRQMFVKADGTPATSVEDLAQSISAAFGSPFTSWRQTLNAAIEQENSLDIFDELQHAIRRRKQNKLQGGK